MSGFTQWFVSNLEPILLPLLPIIVPIILAYASKIVLSFWSKLPANQRAVVKDMVATAVSAVEKKYPNETPEQKKEAAENYVLTQMSAHGIRVPLQVLDPMIEAAVLELDQYLPKASGTVTSFGPPVDLHNDITQQVPIPPR